MKIEYLHASKFGNGAAVAAEFERQMAAKDVTSTSITYASRGRRSSLAPTSTSLARPGG